VRTRIKPSDIVETDITYFDPENDSWPESKPGGRRFPVVVPPRLSGSDYSAGGLAERANYETFTQRHADYEGKFWWPLRGSHGTFGVAIRDVEGCPPGILDDLEAVERETLMDGADDVLVRLESERQDEAWDAYGEDEFVEALEGVLHEGRTGMELELLHRGHLSDVYRTLGDIFGIYPECETPDSVHFGTGDLAKNLDRVLSVWDMPASREGEAPPPNLLAVRLAKAIVDPDTKGVFRGADADVRDVLAHTWRALRRTNHFGADVMNDRLQERGPEAMWAAVLREPDIAWRGA